MRYIVHINRYNKLTAVRSFRTRIMAELWARLASTTPSFSWYEIYHGARCVSWKDGRP